MFGPPARWQARLAAFAGGGATGLATGFAVALVALGHAGDPGSPRLFTEALADGRAARWMGTAASLAAALVSGGLVARLERRRAAAGAEADARLAGFAALGLVAGLVAGALLTVAAHGR